MIIKILTIPLLFLSGVVFSQSGEEDLAATLGYGNDAGGVSITNLASITFTGTPAITVPSNVVTAWQLQTSTQAFLKLETTTSSEKMTFNHLSNAFDTGINTDNVSDAFLVDGGADAINLNTGMYLSTVTVNNAASPYTLLDSDIYIEIDASGGTVTVDITGATANRVVHLHRVDNNPATVVTITGVVNGATNPTSTGGGSPVAGLANQYGSITLKNNSGDTSFIVWQ